MIVAFLLVAAPAVVLSPAAMAEDGGFVKIGQPVSELRAKDAEEPRSPSRSAAWPEGWSNETVRMLALAVASIATLAALLLLWRHRRFRAGAGAAGTRLEILDRIALSTRQWVCILRVDDKRVVVGVSGDTMTSLAVLDGDASGRPARGHLGDRAARAAPLDVDRRGRAETAYGGQSTGVDRATTAGGRTRRDEPGFWFRPESPPGEGAPAESEAAWENHLAPYRREVNRLRAMLQNWRQTTDRGERAQTDGGEGKGE